MSDGMSDAARMQREAEQVDRLRMEVLDAETWKGVDAELAEIERVLLAFLERLSVLHDRALQIDPDLGSFDDYQGPFQNERAIVISNIQRDVFYVRRCLYRSALRRKWRDERLAAETEAGKKAR